MRSQVVVAHVVRAALEQRDRDRHRERVAHGRDVALEELVLQVLVPVETMTLPPHSSAGTRYAKVLPVPVPASAISVFSPPSIAADAVAMPTSSARCSTLVCGASDGPALRAGRRCASNIAGSGIARPDASIAAATARAMSICDARER